MEDRTANKYKSATHYLLASLVPYTEANLKLVYLPHRFFADLDKIALYKAQTLRNSFYKAKKAGLVEIDVMTGQPIITESGLRKLGPYRSKELKGSSLMVTFDIPEVSRYKRQQLRQLLRQLEFTQAQKSVWSSVLDSREFLKLEIKRLKLEKEVLIYECRSI